MKKVKLQTKISILIFFLLIGVVLLLSIQFFVTFSNSMIKEKGEQALSVSRTVANIPEIIEAFDTLHPEKIIQPIAERIRKDTGARFVVVGNKDTIRYSHPKEDRIGKQMVGDDNERALEHGEAYVSRAVGSLGSSVRGKVPIKNEHGEVIGVVSVGFLEDNIDEIVLEYLKKIFLFVIIIMCIGSLGAFYIAKGVKKLIFGLEPEEIALQYLEKNAIIESVREGIIAVDKNGKITTINERAFNILGLKPMKDYTNIPIQQVLENTKMLKVLADKKPQFDDETILNGKEVIVNRLPIIDNQEVTGAVASFRLKDEIDVLAKELTQVHQYADTLRSQAHEYSNKLSTIAGLIQIGKTGEALDLIQTEAHDYENLVHFIMDRIPHPLIAGIILGKYNRAQELKISFSIHRESSLHSFFGNDSKGEKLVTILGNLIDNAFEAVQNTSRKTVELFITDIGEDIIFEIMDSGPGIPRGKEERIFEKGYTTKCEMNRGFGLFLVKRALDQLNGYLTIDSEEGKGTTFTAFIPKKN
ncbi:ATP-binding protein [Siminovitchia fortis]|uniref:ATP-binding protein n=1 Tax=Siminovitchia fortis TaxID=254758 RepID=UPI0011A3A536|nr:sensor histidine kinase [Siminovitchia fortis]